MSEKMIQSVTITLADGRAGSFTGRVLVSDDDDGKVMIASVTFASPRPLPDGCEWGNLKPDVPPTPAPTGAP